ncbi:MAG: hypothetical protein HUU35_06485 [Armatimonadetes bacterium]|nr:hypothetical protein [Armatimonadota bacterium]
MPFEEEGIGYGKAKDSGPVARLQQRIDQGQVQLAFEPDLGFLPALLKELDIPPESQMLVFSKSSFQRERISPQTPRALYFGDDAYIGFIPGSPMLELTSVDPQLGAVFYTLEQKPSVQPRFIRTDQCLECHASSKTMGVPGHVIRSFQTDETGLVNLASGISPINHRTPLAERWGGWYVTGTHGAQIHRGNLIGPEAFAEVEALVLRMLRENAQRRHGSLTLLRGLLLQLLGLTCPTEWEGQALLATSQDLTARA